MAKKLKPPAGTNLGSYNGHPMIQFGDSDRPPQFGIGKAKGLVNAVKLGATPEQVVAVAMGWGGHKLADVDAKLVVRGATWLVDNEEAAKEAVKPAAAA